MRFKYAPARSLRRGISPLRDSPWRRGICETSPVNIADAIAGARPGFEIAGRGCVVRIGEDEPRYATVAEIAARLEPHEDATMLLTAVSEGVERYNPLTEAGIHLDKGLDWV